MEDKLECEELAMHRRREVLASEAQWRPSREMKGAS